MKNVWILILGVLMGLFVQTACSVSPVAGMSPAVLHQSTPETTQQLSNAVAQALNVKRGMIYLAPDVFTKNSQLIIERNTQEPASMAGLNGRLMGVPVIHRFALMKRSGQCYLVYQKTGKPKWLKGLECHNSTE